MLGEALAFLLTIYFNFVVLSCHVFSFMPRNFLLKRTNFNCLFGFSSYGRIHRSFLMNGETLNSLYLFYNQFYISCILVIRSPNGQLVSHDVNMTFDYRAFALCFIYILMVSTVNIRVTTEHVRCPYVIRACQIVRLCKKDLWGKCNCRIHFYIS